MDEIDETRESYIPSRIHCKWKKYDEYEWSSKTQNMKRPWDLWVSCCLQFLLSIVINNENSMSMSVTQDVYTMKKIQTKAAWLNAKNSPFLMLSQIMKRSWCLKNWNFHHQNQSITHNKNISRVCGLAIVEW